MDERTPRRTKRAYPAFWERAVPVLLAIIGVAIVALLLVALLVALGLFPQGIR